MHIETQTSASHIAFSNLSSTPILIKYTVDSY